jgi:hypothetical protein
MINPVVLDFETEGIEARPKYPPVPVGLAIFDPLSEFPDGYHAFGHITGNNTTKEKVHDILTKIYASGRPILFHNAMFDLDVIETHFGLPIPDHHLIHDTLILAFLNDPHVDSLSLKELVVTNEPVSIKLPDIPLVTTKLPFITILLLFTNTISLLSSSEIPFPIINKEELFCLLYLPTTV